MADNADEMHLIEAARADPHAFAEIYERYVRRIYRYMLAQLHDSEEAADATQQIFLRAWQSLARYRPDYPFAAWLFGIARHVLNSSRSVRPATVPWESIAEEAHPLTSTGNPEAVALLHEAQTHMQRLLRRLSPEKQELLALHRDDDLSINEIALIVGKNPEAVRKQIARTLKTLREHYYAADR